MNSPFFMTDVKLNAIHSIRTKWCCVQHWRASGWGRRSRLLYYIDLIIPFFSRFVEWTFWLLLWGKWRSDCRPFVWRILTLFPPPVRRRPVVRSGQDLLPEHAEQRFLRSLRVLLRRQKVLRLLHQNRFSAIIWIYSILSFAKTVLVLCWTSPTNVTFSRFSSGWHFCCCCYCCDVNKISKLRKRSNCWAAEIICK